MKDKNVTLNINIDIQIMSDQALSIKISVKAELYFRFQ